MHDNTHCQKNFMYTERETDTQKKALSRKETYSRENETYFWDDLMHDNTHCQLNFIYTERETDAQKIVLSKRPSDYADTFVELEVRHNIVKWALHIQVETFTWDVMTKLVVSRSQVK